MEVIIWQSAIFFGIIGIFVFFGKRAVIYAAIAAGIWSVAMIFTGPLMILQLTVTAVATWIALFVAATPARRIVTVGLLGIGLVFALNNNTMWQNPFSIPGNGGHTALKRDDNGRLQRSSTSRAQFVRANPCPATGLSSGSCPGYIVDHIVPLKRSGPDTPKNMQWQTEAAAKAKDRWE